MAVVNCFDAFLASRLKRASGALLVAGFVALPSPFKSKAFLYQFAEVLCIGILLFLARGGDGLHVLVAITILDLCHQHCIASFTKECHEEPLEEGCINEKTKKKGCDLLVHHMDKAFGLFAGWYDCKDWSQFLGLV
jgi:hypothetical protein